jgi:hypothetical protein
MIAMLGSLFFVRAVAAPRQAWIAAIGCAYEPSDLPIIALMGGKTLLAAPSAQFDRADHFPIAPNRQLWRQFGRQMPSATAGSLPKCMSFYRSFLLQLQGSNLQPAVP